MEPEQRTATETPDLDITALLEQGLDALEKGEDDAEPVDMEAGTEEAEPAEEASEHAEGSDTAADEGLEDSPADEAADAADGDGAGSAVAAPEHWSQADKDFMAGLPDDGARQRVLEWRKQIERGADTKFQEAAEIRRTFGEVDDALKPLDGVLQQTGISRGEAVRRLVAAHNMLTSDVGEGLATIAGSYARSVAGTDQAHGIVRQVAKALGVEIGGGQPQEAGQAQKDPARVAEETVRKLLDQQRREEAQRYESEVRTAAQAKLNAFVEAKDEGGKPRHPHYEAVKLAMTGLMQAAAHSGQNMTLEQAYEQAVWTRPELREAMTEAQRTAAAKAEAERRRSKVAQAKSAGTPRTASAQARTADQEPPKDIDTLLNEGMDQLMGAAH